jgi:phytoene synthase
MQQEAHVTLEDSYAYCERLARNAATNFYPAFRVLPGPKRRAMCALYAFLRVADDLTDGPGTVDEKQTALVSWREQFARALERDFSHSVHPALCHSLETYNVPSRYLYEVLDGVEMDLKTQSYSTFRDLYTYCYRVASAVGLACIHVWGFREGNAEECAEKAGIAFQLTNILRDLPEDAARGRIYLPQEDFHRFGYRAEDLVRQVNNEPFRNLMRLQVGRAREYYDASVPLSRLLDPAGRAVFQVMRETYRSLLDAIEQRNYDVFTSRVRLSRWRKVSLIMRAIPTRLGYPLHA